MCSTLSTLPACKSVHLNGKFLALERSHLTFIPPFNKSFGLPFIKLNSGKERYYWNTRFIRVFKKIVVTFPRLDIATTSFTWPVKIGMSIFDSTMKILTKNRLCWPRWSWCRVQLNLNCWRLLTQILPIVNFFLSAVFSSSSWLFINMQVRFVFSPQETSSPLLFPAATSTCLYPNLKLYKVSRFF